MERKSQEALNLHADSLLAHGGGGFDPETGAVVPPIPTATTFVRDEAYELVNKGHLYSRDDNDLYTKTEALIATLEGGKASRLFASGMAAVAAIARIVKPGGTILAQSGIYWGTTLFLRQHCSHNSIALIECDTSDLEAFEDELTVAQPDLVWLEVPSNPFLKIADIRELADRCKPIGALLAVDATVATPLILKPLALGADFVMHSATKALNGHSDLLGGVVTTNNAYSDPWALLSEERTSAGAVMGSFEAWLLLRGLRTLALRVERMNANAQTLAEYLDAHPKVQTVNYPGLKTHPGHELAKTQMTGGFGSLMSILVEGGSEEALQITGALRLFQRATSLGGTESLVEHRRTVEGTASEVPGNLLRLSIGIEHVNDLIADLDHALSML